MQKYRIKNADKIKKQRMEYDNKYNNKNKEKMKQYRKKNYLHLKDYSKKYYYNNLDKHKENMKIYYQNNSNKIKKNIKGYLKTSKGRENHNLSGAKRRAMNNNVIHKFTKQQWIEKKKSTNGTCPYCNKFVGIDKLTLDHIFPLYRANKEYQITGIKRKYTINDVKPLCLSCNCKKNDSLVAEVWADAFNYVTEINRPASL